MWCSVGFNVAHDFCLKIKSSYCAMLSKFDHLFSCEGHLVTGGVMKVEIKIKVIFCLFLFYISSNNFHIFYILYLPSGIVNAYTVPCRTEWGRREPNNRCLLFLLLSSDTPAANRLAIPESYGSLSINLFVRICS